MNTIPAHYTVLPVAPHNITINTNSSYDVLVQWDLANQNEDDLPDNITVRFEYSNRTVATQSVVEGSQTEVSVRVVPGMTYTVLIMATNQDGLTESESTTYQSLPGRESIHSYT